MASKSKKAKQKEKHTKGKAKKEVRRHQNLTEFPDYLWGKKDLIKLDLSDNKLLHIPPNISTLPKISELRLTNNEIAHISPEIGCLQNLVRLELNKNRIEHLPRELFHLHSLTELDVSENRIQEISPDLGSLISLVSLRLTANRIKELPNCFRSLTNLSTLRIAANSITELPSSLGSLKNLRSLHFDQDMLVIPPPEVCSRGLETILAFLRELGQGTTLVYRTKLMFVGWERVGKTSLRCTLSQGFHSFNAQSESTDGVDIGEWNLAIPNDAESNSIVFSTWDFAGQVVYYVSHQLFLASRSLFVLVWDLTEDPDLEFWLCSIRSRAGEKAPIIIVATHLDRFIEMASQEAQVSYPSPIIDQKVEQKLNLARETYQLEFPQIVDFFAVSCASGQNLSHVTRKIQETALEQEYMPEKVPSSWAKLRNLILSCRDYFEVPCISWMKFQESIIAQCEGIHEPKAATQFLHDLGDIYWVRMSLLTQERSLLPVHYKDISNKSTVEEHAFETSDLRDLVILKPQWLIDVLRCVVTNTDNALAIEDGVLPHVLLRHLWETYPEHLHPYFLLLMEHFEISFRLNTHTSLVPSLLPMCCLQPEKVEFSANNAMCRIFYDFAGLAPVEFLCRLFVRLHTLLLQQSDLEAGYQMWRTGMFILHDNTRALVELVPISKGLSIHESNQSSYASQSTSFPSDKTVVKHFWGQNKQYIESALVADKERELRKMLSYRRLILSAEGNDPAAILEIIASTIESLLQDSYAQVFVEKRVPCCHCIERLEVESLHKCEDTEKVVHTNLSNPPLISSLDTGGTHDSFFAFNPHISCSFGFSDCCKALGDESARSLLQCPVDGRNVSPELLLFGTHDRLKAKKSTSSIAECVVFHPTTAADPNYNKFISAPSAKETHKSTSESKPTDPKEIQNELVEQKKEKRPDTEVSQAVVKIEEKKPDRGRVKSKLKNQPMVNHEAVQSTINTEKAHVIQTSKINETKKTLGPANVHSQSETQSKNIAQTTTNLDVLETKPAVEVKRQSAEGKQSLQPNPSMLLLRRNVSRINQREDEITGELRTVRQFRFLANRCLDCPLSTEPKFPRLFIILPRKRGREWLYRPWDHSTFQLFLLCERPGHWHCVTVPELDRLSASKLNETNTNRPIQTDLLKCTQKNVRESKTLRKDSLRRNYNPFRSCSSSPLRTKPRSVSPLQKGHPKLEKSSNSYSRLQNLEQSNLIFSAPQPKLHSKVPANQDKPMKEVSSSCSSGIRDKTQFAQNKIDHMVHTSSTHKMASFVDSKALKSKSQIDVKNSATKAVNQSITVPSIHPSSAWSSGPPSSLQMQLQSKTKAETKVFLSFPESEWFVGQGIPILHPRETLERLAPFIWLHHLSDILRETLHISDFTNGIPSQDELEEMLDEFCMLCVYLTRFLPNDFYFYNIHEPSLGQSTIDSASYRKGASKELESVLSEMTSECGLSTQDASIPLTRVKLEEGLQCLVCESHSAPFINSVPILSKYDFCILYSSPLVAAYQNIKLVPVDMLDFSSERQTIQHALDEAKRSIHVLAECATMENLGKIISEGCTAFHFSGHGDPKSLIFEDENCIAQPVDVDKLKEMLSGGGVRKIRFCFISACHSQDAAHAFIEAGVKHVVAVQKDERIADWAAESFSRIFYSRLFSGSTVNSAFQDAKRQLALGSSNPSGQYESTKFMLLPHEADHNIKLFPSKRESIWTGSLSPKKCSENLPSIPLLWEGRQLDMYRIVHELTKCRILALSGTRGVGKSSLGISTGHYLASRYLHKKRNFTDGIIYVEFSKETDLIQPAYTILQCARKVFYGSLDAERCVYSSQESPQDCVKESAEIKNELDKLEEKKSYASVVKHSSLSHGKPPLNRAGAESNKSYPCRTNNKHIQTKQVIDITSTAETNSSFSTRARVVFEGTDGNAIAEPESYKELLQRELLSKRCLLIIDIDYDLIENARDKKLILLCGLISFIERHTHHTRILLILPTLPENGIFSRVQYNQMHIESLNAYSMASILFHKCQVDLESICIGLDVKVGFDVWSCQKSKSMSLDMMCECFFCPSGRTIHIKPDMLASKYFNITEERIAYINQKQGWKLDHDIPTDATLEFIVNWTWFARTVKKKMSFLSMNPIPIDRLRCKFIKRLQSRVSESASEVDHQTIKIGLKNKIGHARYCGFVQLSIKVDAVEPGINMETKGPDLLVFDISIHLFPVILVQEHPIIQKLVAKPSLLSTLIRKVNESMETTNRENCGSNDQSLIRTSSGFTSNPISLEAINSIFEEIIKSSKIQR